MQKKNKKFLGILACASALATTSVFSIEALATPKTATVQAARTSVAARSYGVDVSSYQSSNIASTAQAGAQFAIVKVSEGTSYRNPKAAQQIASANATNMMPMAYHFATFGANSAAAANEGNYAVASAKALGLPAGSYIACDWETGQGNNVNGGKDASANAIVAFMDKVKAAGYQPLLYSGAYLLNNNVNTNIVLNKYPNALWVASYATMGRIDTADFNYFPSMNGVAIWQFTDNWRGLNVDGNITLLPLQFNNPNNITDSNATQEPSSQGPTNPNAAISEQAKPADNKTTPSSPAEVKTQKTVMHKAYVYDKDGNKVEGKVYSAYSSITVLGGIVAMHNRDYYKVGDNQYVVVGNIDGTKRVLKKNAYVYNNKGRRVYVPTLRRGITVPTYGSSMPINGKKYYRINKNRYVKVANFR